METPITKVGDLPVLTDGKAKSRPAEVGDVNIAPTTTAAQDQVALGQRVINEMWEDTQKKIALAVIGGSLLVSSVLAVGGKFLGSIELQLASVVFLYGVANLVAGFYFGRTNHQRTGGVGPNETGR
jgi:hypothetical protein